MTVSSSTSLAWVTSIPSSISGSLASEKTAAHEEFSSPSPLGNGKGRAFEVETRLSRPTSAARLLPTISSPSLTAEGRNPLVGGGDAARAVRFAWLLANPGIGREANQQLVTDRFCRRARCKRGYEAGRKRGWGC